MKQEKMRRGRHLFAILLIGVIIVANIPLGVVAANPYGEKKEGYLTYSISGTWSEDGGWQDDAGVAILDCDTSVTGEFVIPDTIEGLPVTSISGTPSYGGAFDNCNNLTSIVIPASVTYISAYSFAYCENLEKIIVHLENKNYENDEHGVLFDKNKRILIEYPKARLENSYDIPESVTGIERGAFYKCNNLITVTIPNGVRTIGGGAFGRCEKLTNIIIPEGVSSIENGVFESCEMIKKINIPQGVTSVGSRAFAGCKNLVDITIPEGVNIIDDSAFYNCDSLCSITLPDSLTTLGENVFEACDSLTKVDIPNNVTSIGNRVFASCEQLTDVTLPDGMTEIPVGMFDWCDSLTNIQLPATITCIGAGAFANCKNLTSIVIPDGVITIGFEAFRRCVSLTDFKIPNSVTTIESEAFKECNFENIIIGHGVTNFNGFEFTSALKNIEIGNGITEISSTQFSECTALERIKIGTSVEEISRLAFSKTTSLVEITVDENNKYYSSDYNGVLYNKDKSELIKFPVAANIVVYEVADSVKKIGQRAFENSDRLTKVGMSDNVMSIGAFAFCESDNLVQVNMSNNITLIDDNAFWNCSSLAVIELPAGLNYLGSEVFKNTAYYNNDANWRETGLYIDKWYIEPKNNKNQNYIVENGTEYIAVSAFKACRDSIVSIVIPNSVKNINDLWSYYWAVPVETVYYKGNAEEWQKITKDETDFEDVEIIYNYVELMSNDVSVMATKNELDSDSELKVVVVDSETILETISTNINKTYYISNAVIRDISLVKAGEEISTSGEVGISIAIPNNVNVADCKMYYVDELGNAMEVEATCIDNKMFFKTDRLGCYAIIELSEMMSDEENEPVKGEEPNEIVRYGWQKDNVGWWYKNEDGSYPYKTWKKIDGEWYYFNAAGYMVTGWVNDGGTWYYLNSSGAMATGWVNDGGTWYYLNSSGAMATGWVNDGGTWYYLNASGAMAIGWQLIDGVWYYMHGSGAMAANQWVGNYYLQADGAMATNKWIGIYYVGADGAWIP